MTWRDRDRDRWPDTIRAVSIAIIIAAAVLVVFIGATVIATWRTGYPRCDAACQTARARQWDYVNRPPAPLP